MDYRKRLLPMLGLLTLLAGCTPTSGWLRKSGDPAKAEAGEMTHLAQTYVAFGDFRAVSGFTPEHPPATQQQYRDDARLSYQKAIDVDAKCLPAYLGLARLQNRSEDHAGAETTLRKAAEIQPRNAVVWHELGMCQCRKRDFAAAVDSFRKASDLEPSNRQHTKTLGFTLVRAGRVDDGFAVLVRLDGEAKAHLDVARLLVAAKDPQRARQHLESALRVDPQLAGAQELMNQLNPPVTQASTR